MGLVRGTWLLWGLRSDEVLRVTLFSMIDVGCLGALATMVKSLAFGSCMFWERI